MGTMAQRMRLFLIRHGETVDNVAQVYAGSRDSELTSHGYQQATRLGLHFQSIGLTFTHIFSSHLQRAAKTAGLIQEAQASRSVGTNVVGETPNVVQLPVLMEQDFGYYEGKKWYERSADSKLAGNDCLRQEYKDIAGFVDIESKESLSQRVDAFLDGHLVPLLEAPADSKDKVVAVVSHGILLSVLWKRLLLRLPLRSVAFSPEVLANARGYSLEHLGSWSNTGYLELLMQRVAMQELPAAAGDAVPPSNLESVSSQDIAAETAPQRARQAASSSTRTSAEHATNASNESAPSAQSLMPEPTLGWTTLVQVVNGRDHLKGLKRTGGGVGSARHDASQKNIDSFFKRRKVE